MTPFPVKLAAALVAAQAEFRAAPKDSANPAFRSRYADLATVVDTVRPVLARHGLAFLQPVSTGEDGSLTVSTVLVHVSGEVYTSPGITLRPTKADPQGAGSAITYGRRYDLCSLLGIVADDDDDGHSASVGGHRGAPRIPAQPPAQPAGIDLARLRAVIDERGVSWDALEAAMERPAATWTAADRPAIAAALDRLSGGAA